MGLMVRANANGFEADQSAADLLWGLREPPTRGPRPGLTLEGIASTAVHIADSEGLGALSMQRVAAALPVTKMALYRYVSGKAELTSVMIEAAVGEPPQFAGLPGGWRARLEEFARLLGEAWRVHPWLPWATVGDRVMGPRELGWVESAVSALRGTPLDGTERLDAVFVLFGHIRNTQSMSTAGTQPWTADKRLTPTMRRLLGEHAAEYPALSEAFQVSAADSAGEGFAGGSADNGREFGLRRLLDGLELLIDQRGGPLPE
jgi:AcrR family transcriptional regulator